MIANAFILGSAKCATTTLSNWLSQHPDVILAKGKEPIFFNTSEYSKGLDFYRSKYFGHYKNESIAIDAAPMNLVIPFVLKRIAESVPSPKFIILCRDPVDRALSHWWMQRNYRPGYTFDSFFKAMRDNFNNFSYTKFETEYERMKSFDGKFESYIPTFIEQGLYFHHGIKYLNRFGQSNVKFILFDSIRDRPEFVFKDVCDFLNIDSNFKPKFDVLNVSKKKLPQEYADISKVKSTPIIKDIVNSIFRPDIRQLSNLLNLDLIDIWGY